MAWSSIYGDVTSQHFRPVNQILTSNKKATINLLKLLLGFKSNLYLMPSTQSSQACVFIKITFQNWFFLPPAENQVKNSVLKSRNRCDQVMRTKSFWRMTRFWFSGRGHGQGRQNAPQNNSQSHAR